MDGSASAEPSMILVSIRVVGLAGRKQARNPERKPDKVAYPKEYVFFNERNPRVPQIHCVDHQKPEQN